MKTLTIAARFCGPATSSNGGYFAGLVATLGSRTLAVRLLKTATAGHRARRQGT